MNSGPIEQIVKITLDTPISRMDKSGMIFDDVMYLDILKRVWYAIYR